LKTFNLFRDVTLQFIYSRSADNRDIGKCNIDDIKSRWGEMIDIAEGCDLDQTVLRDGHCHEAVMWFTHHLTKENRELLKSTGTAIPLLSTVEHTADTADMSLCQQQVYEDYHQKRSCSSCHIIKPEQCPMDRA